MGRKQIAGKVFCEWFRRGYGESNTGYFFLFYFATGAPVVFIECNWCYRCLFVFSFIYVFVIGGDRKWCTSYIFTNSNYVAIDSGTLQSESAVNTFCYNATIDMLVETMVQNGALKQPNKKEMEKVL